MGFFSSTYIEESQRADSIVFEVPSVIATNEKLFVPVQITDEKVANNHCYNQWCRLHIYSSSRITLS